MSSHDEKSEKMAKRSLEEVLRETWLDALGTLERTETELLRLGERVREALIGDESAATAFTSRVRQRRAELEHRVDEGVRRALARVADPLKGEIAALQERADRLASRLDEQARRRAHRRETAGGQAEDGRRDGVVR